ncbi:MAG TPA: hypothetical protein VGE41_00890 [Verrucomicrobiae bacterium]
MKAYLITTGILFALLTLLHIWKAIDEWNYHTANTWTMVAVTFLPALFAWWAFRLLRKLANK